MDDTEVEDEETLFSFLSANTTFFRVSCVISNIFANERNYALLRKEAQMMNLFHAEEIWRNIFIIVAKQSLNPEQDCASAVLGRGLEIKNIGDLSPRFNGKIKKKVRLTLC